MAQETGERVSGGEAFLSVEVAGALEVMGFNKDLVEEVQNRIEGSTNLETTGISFTDVKGERFAEWHHVEKKPAGESYTLKAMTLISEKRGVLETGEYGTIEYIPLPSPSRSGVGDILTFSEYGDGSTMAYRFDYAGNKIAYHKVDSAYLDRRNYLFLRQEQYFRGSASQRPDLLLIDLNTGEEIHLPCARDAHFEVIDPSTGIKRGSSPGLRSPAKEHSHVFQSGADASLHEIAQEYLDQLGHDTESYREYVEEAVQADEQMKKDIKSW